MEARSSGQTLVLVAAASAAVGSLLTYYLQSKCRASRAAASPEEGVDSATHAASNGELPAAAATDPFDPSPRQGYLSWDDYFMAVAFLSAQRSKDPNKQVGACIVDQNNVICGIGYNGFPRGCSDRQLPWAKQSRQGDPLETKYPYVCHAEMNAILNKNGASVAGARVYVTMFPCNECAKLMIQAGIGEVVYHEAKGHLARTDSPLVTAVFNRDQQYAASRRLLALAGVKLRQHLFHRPVLLRLTNDAKRPAAVLCDCASSSRSASQAAEVQAAAAEAEAADVAPAVAAVLANGAAEGGVYESATGLGGSSSSDAAAAEAAGAAAGAVEGQAPVAQGRRRRRRRGSSTQAQGQ